MLFRIPWVLFALFVQVLMLPIPIGIVACCLFCCWRTWSSTSPLCSPLSGRSWLVLRLRPLYRCSFSVLLSVSTVVSALLYSLLKISGTHYLAYWLRYCLLLVCLFTSVLLTFAYTLLWPF